MAAKIYAAPKEVKLPENSWDDVSSWEENEKKYIADLKQHLQGLGYKEKYTGEIIKFPAADGYAMYMVISMKPMSLMHLPIGDAWTSEYAELMTAKKVQEKIEAEKRFTELWNKKS